MASIYGPVSATGWQLRLDYTVSQDAANNRSALALTLYIYDGTGESYNQAANSCRYVLQGKTVYQPYRYESKGWYKLGSGSVTVNHRSDGQRQRGLVRSVVQRLYLPMDTGVAVGSPNRGTAGDPAGIRPPGRVHDPGADGKHYRAAGGCGLYSQDRLPDRQYPWRGVRENRGDKGDMDAAPVLGGENHRCGGRGLCVDGHHLFRQQRGGDQLLPIKLYVPEEVKPHRQSGGPGGE